MNTEREMPKYQSHKVVHALKIESVNLSSADGSIELSFADQGYDDIIIEYPEAERIHNAMQPHIPDGDTGYLVVYPDGYRSWSPTKAFEEGYTRLGTYSSDELPVLGDGSSNPDYEIPERHD